MPNISYYMHKEGLETYKNLIKIFILVNCILDRNKELKFQLLDYN